MGGKESLKYKKQTEKTLLNVSKPLLEETFIPELPLETLKLVAIYQALRRNNWNRTNAAKDLRISLRMIRYHVSALKELDLL